MFAAIEVDPGATERRTSVSFYEVPVQTVSSDGRSSDLSDFAGR